MVFGVCSPESDRWSPKRVGRKAVSREGTPELGARPVLLDKGSEAPVDEQSVCGRGCLLRVSLESEEPIFIIRRVVPSATVTVCAESRGNQFCASL